MVHKIWFTFFVLSAMTSLTSQGLLDFSGLMANKETKTTTTPAPPQQSYNTNQGYNNQYNNQQYNNQYNQQQQQKPNKVFTKPQKPSFAGLSKDQLKQELKLDKLDQSLKLDKTDKLDKQDKQDKMPNNYNNNYGQDNYQQNYSSLAAPVENPVYSSYVPQLSPPVPLFDDGSYTPQYGPPPQYHGGGQYRVPQHYGSGHMYGNRHNLTAYNVYRQMYGYNNNNSPQTPSYGHSPQSAPVYNSPPSYGSPQYGPQPNYNTAPPPPSYQIETPGYGNNRNYVQNNAPVYGMDQIYDQGGYHDEHSYPTQSNYGPPPLDYSKYISPLPYSEVSDYISPAQYNEYTGNLYQAFNIPAPSMRPSYPSNNYTNSKYDSNNFQMVVAVVVLDGRLGYPQPTNVRGTLFISEIYHRVCLVSGVVQGLPPLYKYGIAIHKFGDTTNGCASIGPHYNPHHKNHGNINFIQSHAGDLGNLQSDANGVAFVNKISRDQFSIQSRDPVAGRAIGICEKQDDLGQGGNVLSLRDGNCGGIQACGIIGLANTGAPNSNSGHY